VKAGRIFRECTVAVIGQRCKKEKTPYKRRELKLVWLVGEYIYETLIVPDPTYHFSYLRLEHSAGRRCSESHLLEIPFSNIGAHHVLAKQNPRWQEKEQPPPKHPQSL
jgi:hypothetical protein